MHFKITYSLHGMHSIRLTDMPSAIEIGPDKNLRFWQREVLHEGKMVTSLCCDLTRIIEPPRRAKEALLALLKNQLILDKPIQNGLPYMRDLETIIDITGRIRTNSYVPFELLPSASKPWISDASRDMGRTLKDHVKTLRWLQNVSGGHEPFAVVGSMFSEDGSEWRSLPSGFSARKSVLKGLDVSARRLEEAAPLLSEKENEPLAHELVREARELVGSAPRSSLLISFSALEAGIKTLISHLVPDANPLVEKIPSPPLVTLIQEVVPSILARCGHTAAYLPLNERAVKYLKKWVQQRNMIAHGFGQSVDRDELDSFTLFVTDILYIIDYYRGFSWACKNLTTDYFRDAEEHIGESTK